MAHSRRYHRRHQVPSDVQAIRGRSDLHREEPVVPDGADLEHGHQTAASRIDVEEEEPVIQDEDDTKIEEQEDDEPTMEEEEPIIPDVHELEDNLQETEMEDGEAACVEEDEDSEPMVDEQVANEVNEPIVHGDGREKLECVVASSHLEEVEPMKQDHVDMVEHGKQATASIVDLEEDEPIIPVESDDEMEMLEHGSQATASSMDLEEDEPIIPEESDDEMEMLQLVLAQSLAPLGPDENIAAQAQRLADRAFAMVCTSPEDTLISDNHARDAAQQAHDTRFQNELPIGISESKKTFVTDQVGRNNARRRFIDVESSIPGKFNEVIVVSSDEE